MIDESISLSKISEYVQTKLSQDQDGSLTDTYNKLMSIAQNFKETSNTFYINAYQVYAAALAITQTSKHSCLLMGAGQGKTIIILLIAAYLASDKTNVKIVVLNDVLAA